MFNRDNFLLQEAYKSIYEDKTISDFFDSTAHTVTHTNIKAKVVKLENEFIGEKNGVMLGVVGAGEGLAAHTQEAIDRGYNLNDIHFFEIKEDYYADIVKHHPNVSKADKEIIIHDGMDISNDNSCLYPTDPEHGPYIVYGTLPLTEPSTNAFYNTNVYPKIRNDITHIDFDITSRIPEINVLKDIIKKAFVQSPSLQSLVQVYSVSRTSLSNEDDYREFDRLYNELFSRNIPNASEVLENLQETIKEHFLGTSILDGDYYFKDYFEKGSVSKELKRQGVNNKTYNTSTNDYFNKVTTYAMRRVVYDKEDFNNEVYKSYQESLASENDNFRTLMIIYSGVQYRMISFVTRKGYDGTDEKVRLVDLVREERKDIRKEYNVIRVVKEYLERLCEYAESNNHTVKPVYRQSLIILSDLVDFFGIENKRKRKSKR